MTLSKDDMTDGQIDAPFVVLPLGVFVAAIVASLELRGKYEVSDGA